MDIYKESLKKHYEWKGKIEVRARAEVYSKEEIFELYVNTSYFGNGYYGIGEASDGYYDIATQNLDLDEASMLAGIPNAPSVYAPTKNPELAKKRQQHVLRKMVEYGFITQEEANSVN